MQPFGAPAEVAGLSKNQNGTTQNSIQIGVGSPLTAMVIQLKNATNEADGFGRNSTSDSWADQEDLMTAGGAPLPTDITAPSLTPDTTIIYFQSGTPAKIFMTTYDEASDAFSYWALRHPADKPDFHDADGFALLLEPSASE